MAVDERAKSNSGPSTGGDHAKTMKISHHNRIMLMGSYRVHFHMSPMPELAYLQHQENKILVRRCAASAVARGVSRVWCVSQSGQAALFRNDRSIMSCMSASVSDQCGPWRLGPGQGPDLGP